jgi:hypothetical protein
MATLTKDTPKDYELGDREEYPVAATNIIFECFQNRTTKEIFNQCFLIFPL